MNWAGGEGAGQGAAKLGAVGMLEAAKLGTARRLRDPGWRGEEGHGRWQARKLLEWAAKERYS